ncbi:MAG: Ig-like domain-containing protein, partial [Coraliomargarita sp.]
MMFLEKRIFRVVALLCALVIGASAQANEIEDDILLFAPAATSTYIPYDLSQVAVYLGDLLGETAGYETADVVFEASTGRSLLESYVHPDIKPVTLASVTAGYRQVILLDNFTFNRDFPEMAFEGTYQMSKAILRSGSTPHLLMGASPSASERAAIQENAYRVANGCGIHLIPAGAGAMEALDTLSIPSLDDDRTSYLVACMIYSQITGQTAASSTYAPTSGGNPIAEAAALASLADSTHATEFAQTQYNTDVGNEGVIRYRPLDISSAPFNNKVRYIYKGTSTENGTSTRLNEIINHTYSAAKNSLGRRDGGWQMLYLSDLERNQATLEGVENQGVFIYARATDVTAATVRSFSQANVLPILYDRPYEYDDSLGVQGPENLLRNFHKDLDYYFGEYYNLGWNLVGFHAALGRFYELEPTLIATTDKVHMSDPMYYMLASQMLTSALGTELPPPSGLSGQALVGYQVGQEFIKQAAHLSEDGAFTPDSRLNVIEPTPHLTEPGVFYSLQLQAEAGSGGYSWEVDPSAALPDGLTLSSTGLISGIATTYFNSQVVVVKVTDTAGAFRKAHLTLFTPPNPVPVPGADTATALSGQPVSIDVLANDFDADGQPSPLSIVSVASPNWGSAEIVAGEIVYTPEGNLSSRDSFSYTITDGEHLVTGSIEVLHNSGYVWIPLDEDTGSSAADAHGSTVGSLLNFGDVEAAHVDGRYGKALSFDGNNDRVDLNTL